ncbi:hypothetical protein bcgnr5411_06470 [Bacillus cereus]
MKLVTEDKLECSKTSYLKITLNDVAFYRRIPYNESNKNKNGVMYYGENNLYE